MNFFHRILLVQVAAAVWEVQGAQRDGGPGGKTWGRTRGRAVRGVSWESLVRRATFHTLTRYTGDTESLDVRIDRDQALWGRVHAARFTGAEGVRSGVLTELPDGEFLYRRGDTSCPLCQLGKEAFLASWKVHRYKPNHMTVYVFVPMHPPSEDVYEYTPGTGLQLMDKNHTATENSENLYTARHRQPRPGHRDTTPNTVADHTYRQTVGAILSQFQPSSKYEGFLPSYGPTEKPTTVQAPYPSYYHPHKPSYEPTYHKQTTNPVNFKPSLEYVHYSEQDPIYTSTYQTKVPEQQATEYTTKYQDFYTNPSLVNSHTEHETASTSQEISTDMTDKGTTITEHSTEIITTVKPKKYNIRKRPGTQRKPNKSRQRQKDGTTYTRWGERVRTTTPLNEVTEKKIVYEPPVTISYDLFSSSEGSTEGTTEKFDSAFHESQTVRSIETLPTERSTEKVTQTDSFLTRDKTTTQLQEESTMQTTVQQTTVEHTTYDGITEQQTTHDTTEQHITHYTTEQQTTHDTTEQQTTHDTTEQQTTHDTTEQQTTRDTTEQQTTHDTTEQQTTQYITEKLNETTQDTTDQQTTVEHTTNHATTRQHTSTTMTEGTTSDRTEPSTVTDMDKTTESNINLSDFKDKSPEEIVNQLTALGLRNTGKSNSTTKPEHVNTQRSFAALTQYPTNDVTPDATRNYRFLFPDVGDRTSLIVNRVSKSYSFKTARGLSGTLPRPFFPGNLIK